MGGRYCSLAVGDPEDPIPALGLLLLGYPLHPAGKPDNLRVEHFPRLRCPVLFLSGDRDALGGKADLEHWAKTIPGPTAFHWLAGGDHGFRVPKALGGQGEAAVMAEVAEASTAWVAALPACDLEAAQNMQTCRIPGAAGLPNNMLFNRPGTSAGLVRRSCGMGPKSPSGPNGPRRNAQSELNACV
jgi:hypothetical protein